MPNIYFGTEHSGCELWSFEPEPNHPPGDRSLKTVHDSVAPFRGIEPLREPRCDQISLAGQLDNFEARRMTGDEPDL
jgi:hypothetical protein